MHMRDRVKAVIDAKPELSVRGVSLAAGLSDSMLNKFLKGYTDSMTVRNAEKLASALGVDRVWLIFGEGDSEPEEGSEIAALFRAIPDNQKPLAMQILEVFKQTGANG